MASARVLQLRRRARPISPSLPRFFSSSSENNGSPKSNNGTNATSDANSSDSQTQSRFSSYFGDVKASLKQAPPPSQSPPPWRKPFDNSATTNPSSPPKIESLDEIRKKLSDFKGKPVSSSTTSEPVSFHEICKRNLVSKEENNDTSDNQRSNRNPSFDIIRQSLKMMKESENKNQGAGASKTNSSRLMQSWKLGGGGGDSTRVIGGSGELPLSVFGKELSDKKGGDSNGDPTSTYMREYSHSELGVKLKQLRPVNKDGKSCFSLSELNERLIKLRKEEEESKLNSNKTGLPFTELKDALVQLQRGEDQKKKQAMMQRLDILSQFGGTPSYMLSPPKENLIESYFHPDHMSSGEKMKLELKKVRDEFKMSESDCGSARVQVAQLTTKINHLSSVLHDKDKHSKKGLLAMVQRRKKLLKYLRRTDWESYCLVLSRLGLRDNPDRVSRFGKTDSSKEKKGRKATKRYKN